jgi:hypothetical protein
MSDSEFRKLASEYLLNRVYKALKSENNEDADKVRKPLARGD